MLIATLIRHDSVRLGDLLGADSVAYAAADPFDGEMLTGWHSTITEVDDALEELDGPLAWGLNIAAYAGESDVPPRTSGE